MPRRVPAARLRFVAASTILLAGVALAACDPGSSDSPSESPSANVDATPKATPGHPAPVFQPDGSAEDNLPIFSAITDQVWESDERGSGRAYVDALVAAGFDRTAMQVTQDFTTVGNPVESLQFSVRWGEDHCIVGQVGPSTGEPVAAVLDQLAEGRCLVGNTRPIDW